MACSTAARPRLARSLFTPRRIAVVGSGESAARLIRWVELTAPGLFEIIGCSTDRDTGATVRRASRTRSAATPPTSSSFTSPPAFDKIVIALPHSAEARLLHLLRTLRRLPVDIVLAPDLMGFNSAEQETAEVAGLKLLSLANRPIREPQRILKAGIDVVTAAVALIALSPLLLASPRQSVWTATDRSCSGSAARVSATGCSTSTSSAPCTATAATPPAPSRPGATIRG